MEERKKLTVLIDADNISPALCEALIQEVAKYGVASVCGLMEIGPRHN